MSKKIVIGIIVIAAAVGAWIFVRNNCSLSNRSSGSDNTSLPYGSDRATEPSSQPNQQTNQNPTVPPVAPATNTAVAVKEFAITGQNYSFTPSTMTVKKGDTVKITFKNADGTHDLRIDEFNAATKRIRTGEEDTVTFVADKTGSFEYYCSVGSHRQMGMKGVLTVTE